MRPKCHWIKLEIHARHYWHLRKKTIKLKYSNNIPHNSTWVYMYTIKNYNNCVVQKCTSRQCMPYRNTLGWFSSEHEVKNNSHQIVHQSSKIRSLTETFTKILWPTKQNRFFNIKSYFSIRLIAPKQNGIKFTRLIIIFLTFWSTIFVYKDNWIIANPKVHKRWRIIVKQQGQWRSLKIQIHVTTNFNHKFEAYQFEVFCINQGRSKMIFKIVIRLLLPLNKIWSRAIMIINSTVYS